MQPIVSDCAGDVFAWVCLTKWNGTFNINQLRHIALVLGYGHPTLICVNSAQTFARVGAIANDQVSLSVSRICLHDSFVLKSEIYRVQKFKMHHIGLPIWSTSSALIYNHVPQYTC